MPYTADSLRETFRDVYGGRIADLLQESVILNNRISRDMGTVVVAPSSFENINNNVGSIITYTGDRPEIIADIHCPPGQAYYIPPSMAYKDTYEYSPLTPRNHTTIKFDEEYI